MSNNAPTIDTHVPVTDTLPNESTELAVGRPDLPTPSLWQKGVRVKHGITGKVATVAAVDWYMNQFRAFYPDEGEIGEDGNPMGRFAPRTEWEQCAKWDVQTMFSPRELERQGARAKLQEEIAQLDEQSLAAVSVLVDDLDPLKALAKLQALRALGVVKISAEAAQAAVEATNESKKKGGK